MVKPTAKLPDFEKFAADITFVEENSAVRRASSNIIISTIHECRFVKSLCGEPRGFHFVWRRNEFLARQFRSVEPLTACSGKVWTLLRRSG